MNTRMVRLFKFTKADDGTADTKAAVPAAKPEAAEARPANEDAAKAAVAALIAEMAAETPKKMRGTRATRGDNGNAGTAASTAEVNAPSGGTTKSPAAKTERRHRRRVKISAPVRVRQIHVAHASDFDVTMTVDVSREGVLFETSRPTYERGQEVAVVFPYSPVPGEQTHEQRGQVVRVARASEKRYGIAVAFVDGEPTYELVDAQGRPIGDEVKRQKARAAQARQEKQMILVVDADTRVRKLLRSQLELHGYSVEDVAEPSAAISILRHRTPAAIISESEAFAGSLPGGGEMSGYDLCVVARRNVKYARMPIILTTRTGLPSDFSTAHALGATGCVAKPYDMERLINLLRMLAPANAAG